MEEKPETAGGGGIKQRAVVVVIVVVGGGGGGGGEPSPQATDAACWAGHQGRDSGTGIIAGRGRANVLFESEIGRSLGEEREGRGVLYDDTSEARVFQAQRVVV